jgi:hypothetical protein
MTQAYNLSQLANNLKTAGQLDATDGLAGAVPAANGGTGQSTYTTGDILYASGATALAKLSDVATGNVLISGGAGAAPSYGKVGLTSHVSGTLPVANGGTGTTTLSVNNVLLGNGSSGVLSVAPGTSGNVLTSNGTTWASATLASQFVTSLSTNGYVKLPGGIIIQWGQYSLTASGTYVNFPIAFPAACASFVAMSNAASTPSLNNVIVSQFTATQFALWATAGGNTSWVAIGY